MLSQSLRAELKRANGAYESFGYKKTSIDMHLGRNSELPAVTRAFLMTASADAGLKAHHMREVVLKFREMIDTYRVIAHQIITASDWTYSYEATVEFCCLCAYAFNRYSCCLVPFCFLAHGSDQYSLNLGHKIHF